MKQKTKRIALMGLLVAAAFVLSWLEHLIPISASVPGVKIGLANLVTVFALYKLRVHEAYFVSVLRVLLASFAFSGLFAGLYALSGALLSLTVMLLMKKIGVFSTVGISICGGVSHNLAQIALACIVSMTPSLVYYLPFLVLSGSLSGALIGLVGALAVKRIKTP